MCAVIGGGGFIGTHLIPKLIASGRKRILVVGRRPRPALPMSGMVKYVQANIGDPFCVNKILDNCDEVIDLAYSSVPTTSFDDPVLDIVENLPASVMLLKVAASCKLRKFVVVSSGGTVFGNAKYLPIDESHPTNPISPYGITKLAVEKYALMFHHLFGLPVTVVRPSNPFGPYQFGNYGQGFIGAAIFATLGNDPVLIFGDRGNLRDYIFIEDLVSGIVCALDCGKEGEAYNIGTGLGMDNQAVLDAISEIALESSKQVRVVRKPLRPFDVDANVLNAAKLTDVSGWKPKIDFVDGLIQTWEWAINEGRNR